MTKKQHLSQAALHFMCIVVFIPINLHLNQPWIAMGLGILYSIFAKYHLDQYLDNL